jgi:hypothetical protein
VFSPPSPIAAGSANRVYRVSGLCHVAPLAAAGKALFKWVAPAGCSGNINFEITGGGGTGPTFSATQLFETGGINNGNSTGNFVTVGLTGTGSVSVVRFDGAFTVPAGTSGTFSLQSACGTSGDTFIIRAYSYFDIMPV